MGNNDPQVPRDDVGDGEVTRYVVFHPGKHDFEAKNLGALSVALSRVKSTGREGADPDFAFHEDFVIKDDRFEPVNTPTTCSRAVEMERLRVLANECKQRGDLATAFISVIICISYGTTTYHCYKC